MYKLGGQTIRSLLYVVVAFIIGELAALVGLDGGAVPVVYSLGILLTMALCYGFVLVGFTIKTQYTVIIVVCFLTVVVGYFSYSKQKDTFEYYDKLQYETENRSLKITGEVSKIQLNDYGYTIELTVDDGIILLQLDGMNNIEESGLVGDEADKLNIGIEDIRYGATLSVTGIVNPMKTADNPGNYNEKSYLRGNGVLLKLKVAWNDCVIIGDVDDYSYIEDGLYRIKQKAIAILAAQCTEKEMGLLSAIILGEKSYMDEDVKELYSSQGIAHVLAISGLHISVVGMGLYGLMRRKMRYLSSATVSAFIMVLFSMMTGNSVSAVRAVIMFLMHVVADVLGRKYDMLSAISLSALILLLDNPFYITNASFILSFAAMIAVSVTAPIVIGFVEGENSIVKTILFNVSLTFTSLPINSCLFYRIPTYSILLNLVVVPFMGLMLAMTIVGIMVSAFFETIGALCIGCAVYILRLYEMLSGFTESLPCSSVVTGYIDDKSVILYYCALIAALFIMWRKSVHKIVLLMLIVFMSYIVYSPKSDEFEICFLDVGQGDGAYIHSVNGNDYLIDSGSTDEENVGKYKIESFLEYKDVDDLEYVFVSHCDTDHISGILELIERENVVIKNLVLPETERVNASDNGAKLVELATSYGVEVKYFGKESNLKDGELEFLCISPDVDISYADINEASMTMLVRNDNLQVFFAGDIGVDTEKQLLDDISGFMTETKNRAEGKITTIYKVAHHGSQYSSSMEMLETLQPDIAVISCGEDNSYGHPHDETIERLKCSGCEIVKTMEYGAVIFKYDNDINIYKYKE
ncbi:MAG: DNA internalization-related competence protein ComEC/Rec2 [Lachnospiraceae bacterium]|nr:DNA internalization-related competence protein ComEC/Rec2 [Lachnospiraceae bacterium]